MDVVYPADTGGDAPAPSAADAAAAADAFLTSVAHARRAVAEAEALLNEWAAYVAVSQRPAEQRRGLTQPPIPLAECRQRYVKAAQALELLTGEQLLD